MPLIFPNGFDIRRQVKTALPPSRSRVPFQLSARAAEEVVALERMIAAAAKAGGGPAPRPSSPHAPVSLIIDGHTAATRRYLGAS